MDQIELLLSILPLDGSNDYHILRSNMEKWAMKKHMSRNCWLKIWDSLRLPLDNAHTLLSGGINGWQTM